MLILLYITLYVISVFVSLVILFKIYEANGVKRADYWNDWPHPFIPAIGGPFCLVTLIAIYCIKCLIKSAENIANTINISKKS